MATYKKRGLTKKIKRRRICWMSRESTTAEVFSSLDEGKHFQIARMGFPKSKLYS